MAQRIKDGHSVSGTCTGAAYQGLARGTENQEYHNPLPKGQNMAAVQVSSFRMFCKKGRYLFINAHFECYLNLKQKKGLFREPIFLLLPHYTNG